MTIPRTVLVADSHEVTRTHIAGIVRPMGFNVLQAIDGASAIKVVQEHPVHLAIFDHEMSPVGGFDFARYVAGADMKLPMILMLTQRTSDLLNFASRLGISHFLAKPVDPHRLQAIVRRLLPNTLERQTTPKHFSVESPSYTPEQLMARAIDLAANNRSGGPFGAVVADPQGHIVGEGVNLITSRCDPMAHAEVMAIRQATERLQQTHLEGFSIFSSSEPTMIGHALIISVGIENMYYGLNHAEVGELRSAQDRTIRQELTTPENRRAINTICLGRDEAKIMFEAWQTRVQNKELKD